MAEIIKFPKENIRQVPSSNVEEMKMSHVDELLEFLNTIVIDNMMAGGVNFDFQNQPDKYLKDLALLSESMRALLYKYYGMDHQLHKLSDKLFIMSNDKKRIEWNGKKFTVRVYKKELENDSP